MHRDRRWLIEFNRSIGDVRSAIKIFGDNQKTVYGYIKVFYLHTQIEGLHASNGLKSDSVGTVYDDGPVRNTDYWPRLHLRDIDEAKRHRNSAMQ